MELIDATKFTEAIKEHLRCCKEGSIGEATYQSVLQDLQDAPRIEHNHAQWIQKKHKTTVCGQPAHELDFTCSACGKFWFHNGEMIRKYLFCPHCGADMRGKENSQ